MPAIKTLHAMDWPKGVFTTVDLFERLNEIAKRAKIT